ncbi:MAG: MMPL family transporter [Actinomycetales bacterium]|nr:MMPL family transporter [Actinomycetales bacterium]
MGGLSRWAVRKPWWAIGAFVLMAMVIGVLGRQFGGTLNDSFSLPDTESLKAQELLQQMSGGQASAATTASATIIWSPGTPGTSAVDAATAATISPLLTRISTLPGVACVTDPFSRTGASLGTGCPKAEAAPDLSTLPAAQQAATKAALLATQKALSPVSPDGHVAKSVVTFSGGASGTDVPTETAKTIISEVKAANGTNGLQVGANGQVLAFAGQEPPSSEGIGVGVALVILLVAFGSLLTAGLPLVTAGFGVSLGGLLLLFVARFMDVATFAPTLASMIGLGVGIDYSLFVINRFRQAVHAGHDARSAAMEAVNTSGRAVVFAASTVVIALLGLFVMRISFFNGLALAASGTVLLVMLSAVWLLPALLSLLGDRAVTPVSRFAARAVDKGRYGRTGQILATVAGAVLLGAGVVSSAAPGVKALLVVLGIVLLVVGVGPWFYAITRDGRTEHAYHPEGKGWAHYARLLQRRPIIPAVLSLAAVLLLATPALGLRLGFPDDSGTPPGSISRIAYDLTAEGFGPGANGPFVVAVQLSKNGDVESLGRIIGALEKTEGVTKTVPNLAMLPLVGASLRDSSITAIQVQPTTGPQDEATTQLLDRLRTETLPPVTQATQSEAYVGGTTAITADFSSVMQKAMPIFLSVVVGLGFLMLLVLFRSAVVSLTAVVTSLLSFAASTGITVAVFQWGWLDGLLGVTGTGPIFPFLPVMVFAILFGLSMDYQVFLVSRMQEEWARTQDNAGAVRRGLGGSGRVVLMAALIMASVFAAFIPTPNNTIKLFGVALASAVLVDALVIRLVFVPSFMSIIGKANWWLPGRLATHLPHFEVEGGEDEIVDDEPEAIGEPEPAGAR